MMNGIQTRAAVQVRAHEPGATGMPSCDKIGHARYVQSCAAAVRTMQQLSADGMFSRVTPARPASGQPVCALAVDAEEDFDWDHPVASTEHSTGCMQRIDDLQRIVGLHGLRPTYLLTYPVLQDDAAVALLRQHAALGLCDLGIQLHPWVTPPFDGEESQAASYSGNLAAGLEARKLVALVALFQERFGQAPRIYRAGRYGLGQDTAALLEQHGFDIDTSVAPRTNSAEEGGPDYAAYDYEPFWFGQGRQILELPLCRSIVGWGGKLAPAVYRRLGAAPAPLRLRGLATRVRFAERITLSPEGNDLAAMLRLLRHLRSRGQTVFVLSFHSSSLAPGRNPYVRTQADLDVFYGRLTGVLDAMAGPLGFRFASLAELPALLGGRGDAR